MACCPNEIDLCIAQGADKTFRFEFPSSENIGAATEITFEIWADRTTGASLLSKSLTGGGITIISDTAFTVPVTDTESAAFTRGLKYCEAWVTTSSGLYLAGFGPFEVTDTRGQD